MKIHVIMMDNPDLVNENYRGMLYKLQQSAAEFMPEAEFVVHEIPPPAVRFHTAKVNSNFVKLIKQVEIAESATGDYILMDCDMLFTGSVEDVFDDNFDICFTETNTDRCDIVPINAGMLFCRPTSVQIFRDWLTSAEYLMQNIEEYNVLFSKHKGICQASLARLDLSQYVVKYMPCEVYNCAEYCFPPPDDVKCLHFNSAKVRNALHNNSIEYPEIRQYYHKYKSIPTEYEKQRFKSRTGYDCNYQQPETFNEKIQWKKHNDRNPLIAITSDKIAVREYVTDKGLSCLLADVRWQGRKIKPEQVRTGILKSNNASGRSFWIKPETDRKKVVDLVNEWTQKGYGAQAGEWAYQCISPECFIERAISKTPADCIKVLCFHGDPRYIYAQKYNRDFSCSFIAVYNTDWIKQDVRLNKYATGDFDKPENLAYILETARILSDDFDFVRVDFMLSNGKLWFSELTHYPTSGQMDFHPVTFDKTLGDLWQLTR